MGKFLVGGGKREGVETGLDFYLLSKNKDLTICINMITFSGHTYSMWFSSRIIDICNYLIKI